MRTWWGFLVPEDYVPALGLELLCNSNAPLKDHVPIPARTGTCAPGKDTNEVRSVHGARPVKEAHAGESDALDGPEGADAARAAALGQASSDGCCLFCEVELRDEVGGLGLGLVPFYSWRGGVSNGPGKPGWVGYTFSSGDMVAFIPAWSRGRTIGERSAGQETEQTG